MQKLNQLAKIISGHSFRKKVSHDDKGNILVLQMKDIQGQNIVWTNAYRTVLNNVRQERFLKKGDILLLVRGRRNTAIRINHLDQAVTCSAHFYIIRALDQSKINTSFLHWYLNQQEAQHYFARNAQGSDVQSVKRDILERMLIPKVDINMQDNIATLAERIYQHQQGLHALIANDQQLLDCVAQSLLKQWP